MGKSCEKTEEMLVDYADGQLSPGESNKVAEHLEECESCRKILAALNKSLELAGVIWTDGLCETKEIPHCREREIGPHLKRTRAERVHSIRSGQGYYDWKAA